MTLYELIAKVSEILTPETNSFYDYVLHTSDEIGCLRTRWCRWEKPVRNFTVPEQENVLICFKAPFREGDAYYEEDNHAVNTLVKMQFCYDDAEQEYVLEWSRSLGYCFAYRIDLQQKTYTVTEYSALP